MSVVFSCNTCGHGMNETICMACAYHCHRDHEVDLYDCGQMVYSRCDCATSSCRLMKNDVKESKSDVDIESTTPTKVKRKSTRRSRGGGGGGDGGDGGDGDSEATTVTKVKRKSTRRSGGGGGGGGGGGESAANRKTKKLRT